MFKSLTPTLSVITSIIIVFFFAKPIFEEAQATSATVAEYNNTIEEYEAFNLKLKQLEDKRRKVPIEAQTRLDQMMPETFDTPQLLVNIERLAEENNLLFGNISVSGEEAPRGNARVNAIATNAPTAIEGLASRAVTFEVVGSYEQFKSFLRRLEQSLNFMEISSIGLLGSSERFQQYSVTIEVYALPSEEIE